MCHEQKDIHIKYQEVLEQFVEKIKRDRYIIAAILLGSLSHDIVWERSDIEMLLICEEDKKEYRFYTLLENDVEINIDMCPRNLFRKIIESARPSDRLYLCLVKGKLLFSNDQSIKEIFEDMTYMGDRDRALEMLYAFAEAVDWMDKLAKGFHVKHNISLCTYYIFKIAEAIAKLEVFKNREFPEREIIHQAKKGNPELFDSLFFLNFQENISEEKIQYLLDILHGYFKDNTKVVYKHICDYLIESNGFVRITELQSHFERRMNKFGPPVNYDWLYRMGLAERMALSYQITKDNRTEMYEPAYRINQDKRKM